MAVVNNCVCGESVHRTKGKYFHTASGARRSMRIKPTFGSWTQLCSSCASEFIGSRPNHDKPSDGGSHVLCDFCNDTITWEDSFKAIFRAKITRWIGKVPRWKGNKQTVCIECRDALNEFVESKR